MSLFLTLKSVQIIRPHPRLHQMANDAYLDRLSRGVVSLTSSSRCAMASITSMVREWPMPLWGTMSKIRGKLSKMSRLGPPSHLLFISNLSVFMKMARDNGDLWPLLKQAFASKEIPSKCIALSKVYRSTGRTSRASGPGTPPFARTL